MALNKSQKPIHYARQDIDESDISAVSDVLRSDFLTQGPSITKFETMIAKFVNCEFGLTTTNATSALHIACKALGLGSGDVLWTSPNSFVASANCALYCDATVDFVDIDPNTYNISIEQLENKLVLAERSGTLPKIVVPVHFAGQPCQMIEIRELSIKYGFKIIEDASHAIGAQYNGSQVGSCEYCDITIFSFHPVKIIATGEGGMALTNDEHLANKMRRYRSHGITSLTSEMVDRPSDERWNYQQIDLGFNYRMTDIQAALGISQMKRIDKFLANRREIASIYDTMLTSLPLIIPFQASKTLSSYHLYPILLDGNRTDIKQSQLYKELHDWNIYVNIHYIPIYRQPYYEKLGFNSGYCPNAENYFKNVITLPIYASLQKEEQSYILDVLKKIFT